MSGKITVTWELAEAIEWLRSEYEMYADDSTLIETHAGIRSNVNDDYESWHDRPILNSVSTETFSRAVLNGYHVEKSPEDNVREYFDSFETCPPHLSAEYYGNRKVIRSTLDLLGIKIEGVNG